MKIHFKKLVDDAVIPTFGRLGDAGADIVATSKTIQDDDYYHTIVYGTGIAVEIPEGMVGLVFPRSSIRDKNIIMSNSVGVIDSGYRGEIMVTFNVIDPDLEMSVPNSYEVSDRIAQLIIIPIPIIEYIEVDELSETERGVDGHGSTGS